MKEIIKDWLPPAVIRLLQNTYVQLNSQKYKDIIQKNSEFKNKHIGERCFILGSGPSLKKEDLTILENEIVFSLNNLFVHDSFPKIMNDKKSKYHICAPIHPPQTSQEWINWFESMESNIPKNVNLLFGINTRDENSYKLIEERNLFKEHKVNYYYAGLIFNKNKKKIDVDITKPIVGAETVSVYAIIIAIYMGFKEIYLLGMDHDYFLYDDESEMRIYKNAIHQKDEFKRKFGDSFYIEEFKRQHSVFLKYDYLDKNSNSKIYNASDGGILKIFPRVKLKDVVC